ncbi:MAG: DUF4843 domain-containing protein [Bacteroidales bacterium]|nr:DUF4843 domain-containing protein [Bacteroidales bacterium]
MKKYLLILTVLALYSCQQNERLIFDGKPGLYFALGNNQDSLTYSMLGNLSEKDTILVPVRIMGNALSYDGKYKIEVIPGKTTAEVGKHYTKLKDEYIFEKGLFYKNFEIEISKSDPELETKSKVIALRITESSDFTAGYTKNTTLRLIITNQIIKPIYWDSPMALYFGAYSKVKHNLIIKIIGHDFPLTLSQAITAPYSYTYWMVCGRAVCQYVIDNDVFDENGNKIMPWSTF